MHETVTKHVGEKLIFPTQLIAQNGAVIKQDTVIGVTGCPPTVKVTNTKLETVAARDRQTSAKGTFRISGKGLRTVTETLAAGTHQIRVKLTGVGRSLRARQGRRGSGQADRGQAGRREHGPREAIAKACPAADRRDAAWR